MKVKVLLALSLGLILAIAATLYISDACHLRRYGRIVATRNVSMNSKSYTLTMRERNYGGLQEFILLDRILRDHHSCLYEYWIELRRDEHLVATSPRLSWGSATYDHPRIETVDSIGATVLLRADPRYPSISRFEWTQPFNEN